MMVRKEEIIDVLKTIIISRFFFLSRFILYFFCNSKTYSEYLRYSIIIFKM